MTHFEKRIPVLMDLGATESSLPRLQAYLDLLWSANKELNLFSRKMPFEELIDNHLIDCLLPLKFFPKDISTAADFGSGGGLPGVVYAIQMPQVRYQLFEKSPLKRDFLNQCQKLALNIEVSGEIPPKLKVDLVTARAFKPIDVILEMSRDYYENAGKYFLLKGRREKINEEITLARQKFKTIDPRIETLQSPVLEVERHLVLI